MKIIKVARETLPDTRLIGKRYANAERKVSRYTGEWVHWFYHDWFAPLQQLELLDEHGDAFIGSMRWRGNALEYWIGMMAKPGSPVPEGYEYLDIPGGDIGVVWLQGPDDFELYSHHDRCVETLRDHGFRFSERANFVERYTQERFVTPDRDGNVIMDYFVHLDA